MLRLGKEFKIIQQYFEQQQNLSENIVLGIGDDCALFAPSEGMLQAISIDTSVVNRHFPEDADPFDIAYRSLNIALSDLAAMGATAKTFTLALSLPRFNAEFLERFSKGLFTAANNAGAVLIGGDTTRGPLSITVQVQGDVAEKNTWQRSGAKVGDTIYVSGNVGDAAAGLDAYQKKKNEEALLTAYLRPEPEFAVVSQLSNKAISSCIDISDGLLADLAHILRKSGVGAEIDCDKLPLSDVLLSYCSREQALQYALTGGDDYKLLLTSSEAIDGLYAIGIIAQEPALRILNQPDTINITTSGYDHFNE